MSSSIKTIWFCRPDLKDWLSFTMRHDCDRSMFNSATGEDESLFDAMQRYFKGGYTLMLNCSPYYHPKYRHIIIKRRRGE